MTTRFIAAAGLAALATLGATASAGAVVLAGSPPNYAFPDGSVGFALATFGGKINPGVLVGFNPQPDPPGIQLLGLGNPAAPTVTVTSTDHEFRFELNFTGITNFHLLVAPDRPNSDGRTSYGFCDGSVRPSAGGAQTCDGSVFVADLAFSGPGGVFSWVALNPQPEPPGIGFTVAFGADASVTLSLTENGTPLQFAAAPEPATWSLMGLGFAALAAASVRRRRSSAA